MAEPNLAIPVEDVPEDKASESYQTGIAVTPSANGDRGDGRGSSKPRPSDLLTEVNQVTQRGGKTSIIIIKGLAGAIVQKAALRVGSENHMAVYRKKGSSRNPESRQKILNNWSITREKSMIIAMAQGAVLQVGSENHMTVYQGKGSSKNPESRPKIPCKRPVTTSSAEPTSKQLDSICESLGRDWQRLGRHLEIDDAILEQIRLDYYMEGQHEINYRMLQRWKQMGGASLNKLAQAFVDVGRGDLADLLADN